MPTTQAAYRSDAHRRFANIVQETLDASQLTPEKFGERLRVSRGTVVNWAHGNVSDPLNLSAGSLQSLARIRGELMGSSGLLDHLLEEIRGGPGFCPTPKPSAALLVKRAGLLRLAKTMQESLIAAQEGLYRLQDFVNLGISSMSASPIADIIRGAFELTGRSIDSAEDFQEFLDIGGWRKAEDVRKIKEIAQGRMNLPLGDAGLAMRLAATLHKFADVQYEPEDLMAIAEEQEDRHGDRHHFPS